uniref:USP domain-containing protein n=1 Tax=Strigamia maritima TaxID=126957 RepID=T1J5J5_STRMM
MVEETTPAYKPRKKMKAPSWMNEFDGTLSVRGKGSFSSCFRGTTLDVTWNRGNLQLYRKKLKWMVQFCPDGQFSPYERPLTSKFNIQGYAQERSFYKNFVQHGKIQILFGKAAFLQFDFEDYERDEEMLKKISSVFEYFFSKDENCSFSTVSDVPSVQEIPLSKASPLKGRNLFPATSLCQNILDSLEFPSNDARRKVVTISSPEIQPMDLDCEPNNFGKRADDCNKGDSLFSSTYIDRLMCNEPKFHQNQLSPKKDSSRLMTSPVKVGILSPSSKNNIKTETPANSQQNRKQVQFLTSAQCRGVKKDLSKKFGNDNLNEIVSGSSNAISQTTPRSFYGANRNASNSRKYNGIANNIEMDDSPGLFRYQRPIRNYTRLTSSSKREYDSIQSTVCLNESAKKIRLAKERDEKENDDCQGFVNIRNSCYMNSILQALLSFPILISHLSNEKYSQIDNGLLWSFLELNHIRFEASNSRKYRTLHNFKDKMIKASNNFSLDGNHEDAHEYFLSLKEALQQEIQMVFPNDKVIDDIMNVEMVETRMCPTCSKRSKNTSISEQTHSELGVDIPEDMNFEDKFRLRDLIESTLKSSTVRFNCECGETHVDLLKRFSRLPQILVIHLHRYCLKGGVIEKNLSNIFIPEALDLKRFCTDNVSIPRSKKKRNFLSSFDDGPDCKYQLQAVIEHLGNWANGGHYIARVRHKTMWLKCDDERITEMRSEDIAVSCQQSAYLLFYVHSSQMNEVG